MTLLAIETSSRLVGCALWADGELLASFSLVAGPRHAEVLMPAIDDLLARAGVARSKLSAVAVDVGPGLFTGLRVGIATATATASALQLPAVSATSLDVLAHPHRYRPGLVAAVVDARRGEVFWSLYEGGGGELVQLCPPEAAAPEAMAAALAARAQGAQPSVGPGAVLAVGDGAWRYRDLLAGDVQVPGPGPSWPAPSDLAQLAAQRLGRDGPPTGLPVPVYLRQADVRIGWDQVGGRVGGAEPVDEPRPVAPGS